MRQSCGFARNDKRSLFSSFGKKTQQISFFFSQEIIYVVPSYAFENEGLRCTSRFLNPQRVKLVLFHFSLQYLIKNTGFPKLRVVELTLFHSLRVTCKESSIGNWKNRKFQEILVFKT